MNNDVEFRSDDDRMCQSCHDKNEAELEVIPRRADDTGSVKITPTIPKLDRVVKHASSS
jgi:hypothetical protein